MVTRCVLLTLLLFSPAFLPAGVVDEVNEPSVTILRPTPFGYRGCGTGTVIKHNGKLYVLTAAHVLDGADHKERQVIRSKKGRVYSERKASVTAVDTTEDLALLALDDPAGLSPALLPPTLTDPTPGEEVWYSGYGGKLPWNLQRGIVNQYDPDDGYWVNGGGWFGHSGSAVYVKRDGKLVVSGVLYALHSIDNPKSPLIVVPHHKVLKFLKGVK